jgi:UTP-glucose-1-phosphate uridylyltransferase
LKLTYELANSGGRLATPFSGVRITRLVEKPALNDTPANLAFLGGYILPPAVLGLLEDTKLGVGVGNSVN